MKAFGNNIKAVLFDHDDTLVATMERKWAQHKFIAKKHYGKTLTDEELKTHWGKPMRELLGILYDTQDIDGAMANVVICRDNFPKIIYKYSISVIEQLHLQGKLVGVVTATIEESFLHDLEYNNVQPSIFDYIQTSDHTKYHKPDPQVFEPTIKWLNEQEIAPNEVLYVGDGLMDMHAALGAGFHFIGVETGLTTKNQFAKHGVLSLPNLANLPSLV